MAYHETRLQPGDPSDGPLGQVIAYVDDEGTTYFPGQEGYLEPEEGSAQFIADQGVQLAEDQHRVATGQTAGMTQDQQTATVSEADRLTDQNVTVAGQQGEVPTNTVTNATPGAPPPPK